MRHITIPGVALPASVLCLGTASFGWGADRNTAFQMLDRYIELGGNFIDTARVYGDNGGEERNQSERFIGEYLKSRGCRSKLVLATKGAHPDLKTMHIPRMSRAEIISDLDGSLKDLGTDYIDLFWLHRDDVNTEAGEIIEILNDQVKAGKIRAFGCSNWKVDRIEKAKKYAENKGILSFCANQPQFSLARMNMENLEDKTLVVAGDEDIKYHNETGLILVAFSSQAKGFFSKADISLESLSDKARARFLNETNLKRLEKVQKLSEDLRCKPSQIALAYVTSQSFPSVAIIGPRTTDQLDDCMKAQDLFLTAQQIDYLLN